jgi:type I restriction enzyme M protein
MAPYNTPQAIRLLEKMICDFAYSNGYDPISVFNDFLRYVIHGFSPGAPPLMDWKYKRQQNRRILHLPMARSHRSSTMPFRGKSWKRNRT